MEIVPNDVILIIYRLLHNDLLTQVHNEYHRRVHFDSFNDTIMFEGHWFMRRRTYRYLNRNIQENILSVKYGPQNAIVPENYYYTSGCNQKYSYTYNNQLRFN